MENLKIEMLPVKSLEAYENNAKIHTKEQVNQIANSIREFGFNDPIAIWGNEIVEGHGRVMAAVQMGLDEVPVIRLDHLNDEQRRAYTHIHNQLTMNTGFDFSMLEEEIANLNFDFEEFGFPEVSLDYDPDELFASDMKDSGDGTESDIGKMVITCPHCGMEFETNGK